MKLTASKPAELAEVASWASSPTEVIEWIVEDLNWPPTADPMAALLARHRSGECSAWSARTSDRLVDFGALNVRHGGKVAELSHLLVKRHRHAIAIAVDVVRQLAALAFADPQMEVLRLQVYAHDTLRNLVRHSVELRCPSAWPRDERDPVGVEICRTRWVADL